MRITANTKGLRVVVDNEEEALKNGVNDSTILIGNIASIDIVPKERNNEGVEMVRLNTLTRREIPFHYSAVTSFNNQAVTSNQDLYDKAIEALGLNLIAGIL